MSEPSDSSSRLGHLFKHRSRDKNNRDSASDSLRSTESSSFRSSGRTESDDEGEHNGIKKLVPKGLASKRRRKKQEQEEELKASEEAARGRSVAERGTLSNDMDAPSRTLANGSGDGSSLITYESETES